MTRSRICEAECSDIQYDDLNQSVACNEMYCVNIRTGGIIDSIVINDKRFDKSISLKLENCVANK